MPISLKTAFFAGAMTVLASSTTSYVFAQATTAPSMSAPETADSAMQKAQVSHTLPKTDRLPATKNTIKEQPDQGAPAKPLSVHRDESGHVGTVPPAEHHVWHVSGAHKGATKAPK